jgi:transcriptional regulator with XRE-family HTH domain
MRKKSQHKEPPDLGKALGRAIAARRKVCGLTQDDLAGIVGVDAETISRFERGSVMPSLLRLLQIAQTMQVGIGELLGSTSHLRGDQAQRFGIIIQDLGDDDRDLLFDFAELLRIRN